MKTILITRLSAMGDVAMASPAAAALRKRYPDVKIVVLTRPFFRPFFRDVPDVDFVDVDLKGRHKGFFGILRLYREIKAGYKIDYVADLHDVLRTKILRALLLFSGAKVAHIDKGRREKKRLTRQYGKVFKPLKSTFDRYAAVFRKLGFEVEIPVGMPPVVNMPVPRKITEMVGEKNNSWVGISPFAMHRGKIYPLDKMEKIVEFLSAEEGIRLFIFGGGEREKAVAEAWEAKYPDTLSVIGHLDLDGEIDLIANLDVMVTMDSSAMHMSSLAGTPAVSVWGATHPYAGFMGLGQSAENAAQLELACRPCSIFGNKPCYKGTYECLDIPIDTIINKVLNLLVRNK